LKHPSFHPTNSDRIEHIKLDRRVDTNWNGDLAREKMVRGFAWSSVANWGCQLLSFGVYTGLARLVDPRAFGLIAIAGVYVAFIQVFVTQGFGMAIIQRHGLEEEHLDSAFWITLATASIFCGLSLLLANPIARLFNEPRVAPVVGWLSLSFLFYALSSVPAAILNRDMNFRALAVRGLAAVGVGGATGLAMAFHGWGVWSLVGQQLVGAILGCFCLWWAVPWRPRLQISKPHLRDLYKLCLSITGTDILWFFSQKSDQTLVGYGFGSLALGPYSLASRINTLLYEGIIGPSQSVALPAFSRLQSDPLRLAKALYRYCELSSFSALPVFAGTAAVAPQLVPWLFGSKWSSAVPLLQVLSLYGAMRVLLSAIHPLMLAKGRAGLYLLMNVLQSSLTFAGCMVGLRWGPKAVALSMSVNLLIAAAVFLYVGERILEIRAKSLLMSFAYPVLSSLAMLAAVTLLQALIGDGFGARVMLVLCVAAGIATYISTALLLRPDLVRSIYGMAESVFKRRISTPPLGSPKEEGNHVSKCHRVHIQSPSNASEDP
jgi:O-antigen/teichoic acid export membrane protein